MKSFQTPSHLTLQSSLYAYLSRLSSRLKPETVFLYFACVFGLSLLVAVPPFQSPDAQGHFFRAYQVSEGIMIGRHFRAEYLPKSLKHAWEVTSRDIPLHPERKIAPGSILSAFRIPLNPDDRSFTMCLALQYSPHFYFPQATGLLLGRKLGLGPIALHYVGSLCTLAFCIWLFYWSIRKTPVLKWVFFLLAMTPMNLSLAASCSQDAVINGLAFLFTASVLDLALSPDKEFTVGSVLFPAIVAALLAPAKVGVYTPVLAFFLFIPVRKAGSMPRYLGLVALGIIPAVVTFALWTLASQHQILPIFDSMSSSSAGPTSKTLLLGIWQDPLQYLCLLAKTTTECYRGYVAQFIGILGWTDTRLPGWIVISYVALLFTVAASIDPAEKSASIGTKVIVILVIISVYVGIQTTQYCTYSPPDSPVIWGFLGRYLLPLSPAFFLLVQSRRWNYRPNFRSLFPIVIAMFMLIVVSTTLFTVANRYYGKEQPTWRTWGGPGPARDSKVQVALTSPDDFRQTFECPLNGLVGVSVCITNPSLPPGKIIAGLKFVLRDATTSEVVREISIQPFEPKNQIYLDILFDPILDSKDKKYTFTIFPADGAAKIPISIPLSEPRIYPESGTIVQGRKIDRSVVFELIFDSSAKPDK
jgi:uncharacterized membrane protein